MAPKFEYENTIFYIPHRQNLYKLNSAFLSTLIFRRLYACSLALSPALRRASPPPVMAVPTLVCIHYFFNFHKIEIKIEII
jgi:hypothetical protein